jgi:hypothetical protein
MAATNRKYELKITFIEFHFIRLRNLKSVESRKYFLFIYLFKTFISPHIAARGDRTTHKKLFSQSCSASICILIYLLSDVVLSIQTLGEFSCFQKPCALKVPSNWLPETFFFWISSIVLCLSPRFRKKILQ